MQFGAQNFLSVPLRAAHENHNAVFAAKVRNVAKSFNVAKSLFVFSLLDKQTMPMSSVENYVARVPVFKQLDDAFLHMGLDAIAVMLKTELIAAGAVVLRDGELRATMRA